MQVKTGGGAKQQQSIQYSFVFLVGKTSTSFVIFRNSLFFKKGAKEENADDNANSKKGGGRKKRSTSAAAENKQTDPCETNFQHTNNIIVSAIAKAESAKGGSEAAKSSSIAHLQSLPSTAATPPSVPIDVRITFKKEDVGGMRRRNILLQAAELQYNTGLHGKLVVTWWNTKTRQWEKNDQCPLEIVNGEYVASCSHLTNFALLVVSFRA